MKYDRRFTVFWLGQTLSAFGDAFALVALPLLVLEATGSVTGMGLVSATGVAAQVVASLFSGTIIDRFDRRRTMLVCDLGRAIGYGFLPLMGWMGGHALWVVYLTVIVGGALSNVFSVGYMTAVPALVGKRRPARRFFRGPVEIAPLWPSLGLTGR